jgi:hypothetical protein
MINIRNSVFETNSSSSHSFSFSYHDLKNKKDLGKIKLINNNIYLNGGDFSKADCFSCDALFKANLVAVISIVYDMPELKNLLEQVLKEQTGASKIVYNIRLISEGENKVNSFLNSDIINSIVDFSGSDYEDKYEDLEFSTVLKNKEMLKTFIFNKKCCYFAEISEN